MTATNCVQFFFSSFFQVSSPLKGRLWRYQEHLLNLWRSSITILCCWFREYLSNNSHFVKIENGRSEKLSVLFGLPHGTGEYTDDFTNSIEYGRLEISRASTKVTPDSEMVVNEK